MARKFLNGLTTNALQLTAGASAGYVMQSDGSGNASWGENNALQRNISQAAHGFTVGQLVYYNGTTYAVSDQAASSTAEVDGIIVSTTTNTFIIVVRGYVTGLTGLTGGTTYFLGTSGALTATAPTTSGLIRKPVLHADSSTSGYFSNYIGIAVGGSAVTGPGSSIDNTLPVFNGTGGATLKNTGGSSSVALAYGTVTTGLLGPVTPGSGNGQQFFVAGGNAGSTTSNGGLMRISGGSAGTTSGTGGDTFMSGGSSSSGNGGNVVLSGGSSSTGTAGTVNVQKVGTVFNATLDVSALTASRNFAFPDAAGTITALGNTATGSGSVVLATSPTLVTPTIGAATATTVNKVTITAPTTSATLTLVQGSSIITVGAFALTLTTSATTNATFPAGTDTLMGRASADTITGVKTFGAAGNVGKLVIAGTTSGTTILNATAAASGTLTLPAATDTLMGKATTDTMTNKTYDTAGTGNAFKIAGVAISAVTGTGSVVLGTAPTLSTPIIAGGLSVASTPGAGFGTLFGVGSGAVRPHWISSTGTDETMITNLGDLSATYAVAWTASTTNPSIGNGTLTAYWTRIAKQVTVNIQLTPGTTTSLGSGEWSFSTPSTIASGRRFVGSAYALRSGTAFAAGVTTNGSSTLSTTTFQAYSLGGGNAWQSNTPYVWVNGDPIGFSFTYIEA